jgi:hypothetical protein
MEATHEKDQYCNLGWRRRSVREQRHSCRRVYQRRDVTYLGMNQPNVEQVRLVCDDSGGCYRSRGSRRVVIQQGYDDSYNYAPRERYIERRGYYDDQPRSGIGFGAPGVSIGVGVGNGRW